MNTDFFQSWSVVIEKLPDRLVFVNPGSILTGKKQMLKGGILEPRNKNMMKMFNLLGIGEHAGSGVPDVYSVWAREKFDDPTVEEQFGREMPERTTVTLPLISSSLGTSLGTSVEAETDTGNRKKLLDYCGEPRSKAEIQTYLGIKSERYVRQKLINPLLESGELERTLPDKPSSPKQKYVAI